MLLFSVINRKPTEPLNQQLVGVASHSSSMPAEETTVEPPSNGE